MIRLTASSVSRPSFYKTDEYTIEKKKLKPEVMAAKKSQSFQFTPIIEIATTSVKNQAHTSTCWSFATISFVEAELVRMGKGQFDLSEMFIVRKTYPRKARRYVRMHGHMAFGANSLAGDVMRVIREDGIVLESAYNGKFAGAFEYEHQEMDAVLNAALKAIIKNKGGKLSRAWQDVIEGILDAYFSPPPKKFHYNGKSYTSHSFRNFLGIYPDDYVEITSYNHHPYNSMFSLDVPDNWSYNEYFNVRLNQLMWVIDHALENGYSLVWDGDITEKTFNQKKGIALFPKKEWDERSEEERERICDTPEEEKKVTQQLRQDSFDNYSSTDDHLMHLVGIAKDQNGTKFYKAKNSWGLRGSKYEGYIYMSESYMRAKTVSVMLHKDALPEAIMDKLKIVKLN